MGQAWLEFQQGLCPLTCAVCSISLPLSVMILEVLVAAMDRIFFSRTRGLSFAEAQMTLKASPALEGLHSNNVDACLSVTSTGSPHCYRWASGYGADLSCFGDVCRHYFF